MTNDSKRKKTQAVFFSIVMVLSMVGGSAMIAGSAAAAPTSAELSDNLVNSDTTEVTITGEGDGGDTIYVATDRDGDGQYNGSEDEQTSLSVGSSSGTYEDTFQPTDLGLANGDSVAIYAHAGSPGDGDELNESAGTLTVDATGPNIQTGSATPASDEVVNNPEQEIVVPLNDTTTSVESIEVELYSNGTQMGAYELGPNSEPEGISYQNEELSISPGSGNIPVLQDGTTNVNVNATDTAGNTVDASFSFDVETDGVDFTIDHAAAEENFDADDENNPFEGNEELLVYDENETGVEFDATINPPGDSEVDEAEAELTIDGPGTDGEVTLNNSSSAYNAGTFEVNQNGDNSYNFSADGTYDVTVSGADTAGNSGEYSFDIKVDTTAPTAETITAPEQITEADLGETQYLDVTFDEPVAHNTVNVELRVDGGVEGTVSNNVVSSDYSETVTLEFTPSEGDLLDEIENGSAIANVTSGDDVATNSLTTEGQTETTFEVYTETPGISVSTPTPSSGGDFGGGVNFTSFVDSVDDDVDVTYEILPGNDGNPVDITDSAENYDTTGLPDGEHTLRVSVEDNVSNTNDHSDTFVLDNNQQITVTQKYLDGTINGDYDAGTDNIDIATGADPIFASAPSDTTYTVGTTGADAGDTISAAENRGDTVTVTASSDDESREVTLSFAPLEGAENVDGDTIDIGVRGDQSVDTLNVTVAQNDGYYDESEQTLTYEDFEQYNVSGDEAIYSATVEDLSDGDYDVSISDYDNGAVDRGDFPVAVTVDDDNPELVSASVVDGDESSLTIDAKFSEIAGGSDTISFDDDVSVVGDVTNDNDGTVTVNIDEEAQTADGPLLSFEGVDDATGSGTTTETNTSVATITLNVSGDGLSVVSIPAETGTVDIASDNVEIDGNVNTIWSYDSDGWDSYSPGADNSLTSLEGGQGYLVSADGSASISINAENVPADDTNQALQSQHVDEGWNLIGHYQEGSQSVGQALAPLGDRTYSVQQGYTGTQVDTLDAGQGYWLFVDDSATHVPVDYAGMNSEQPEVYNVNVDSDNVADGDSITISAEVDENEPINTVRAYADAFSTVNGLELTDGNDDGVYNKTVDADFAEGISGGSDVDVRVDAIDIYGNSDSGTTSVSTVAFSGSLAFNDQVLSDDDNVTVEDVESNVDGVVEVRDTNSNVVGSTEVASGISTENVSVDVSGASPGDHTAVLVSDNGVELGSSSATVYSGSVTVDDQNLDESNQIQINSTLTPDDDYGVAVYDDEWAELNVTTGLSGEENRTVTIGSVDDNTDVTAILIENDTSGTLAKATGTPDLSGNVSDTGDINVPQEGNLEGSITSTDPGEETTHNVSIDVTSDSTAVEGDLSTIYVDYSGDADFENNGGQTGSVDQDSIENLTIEAGGDSYDLTSTDQVDVDEDGSFNLKFDVSGVDDQKSTSLSNGDSITLNYSNVTGADRGEYDVELRIVDESDNEDSVITQLDTREAQSSSLTASFAGDGSTTTEDLNVDSYDLADNESTIDAEGVESIQVGIDNQDVNFSSPSIENDQVNIGGGTEAVTVDTDSSGDNTLVVNLDSGPLTVSQGDSISFNTTTDSLSVGDGVSGSASVTVTLLDGEGNEIGSTEITAQDALSYDTTGA